ncbi:MAG: RNA polymerase sporulation sigma factor SigE [Oscillospiraceae bacterium]
MFNRIVKFFKDYIEKLRICIALPDYIYYINGSETLPPPLSQDEEKVVFVGLEEGRQSCKDILIVHNLRLVVYIAKKFESSGIPIEDIISIGTIGLIKAVNTFVPSKNIKLATYASRCIENEILMYLRKSSNRRQESSIDEPLNVDCDGNELLLSDVLGSDQNLVSQELEQAAERSMVLDAVENLGERERQIMQLRFGLLDGKEHTQKEVADLIGISQSYISRLEKRIIKRLRRDLEHIA